jgi:hypothetical protein
MNRKDKDIKKLLFDYSESNKPDMKITIPAKIKLSQKQRKKSFNFFKVATTAVAFVCVFVFVIIGVNTFSPSNNSGQLDNSSSEQVEINYYNRSQLYMSSVSNERYNYLKEEYLSWFKNIENCEIYEYSDINDHDDIYFYYIKGGVAVNGGVAEIELYIEITDEVYNDLKDFQNIENTVVFNSVPIKKSSVYIDGEYMSNAFYTINDIKYYFEIMTNTQGGVNEILYNSTKNI